MLTGLKEETEEGKMGCFHYCCVAKEKFHRKSIKKGIKGYREAKSLASFANISFKTGNNNIHIPVH